MEEKDLKFTHVEEATVNFKINSDRDIMNVVSEDGKVVLIEISGYDLRIGFNMPYLKSIEDIESATKGIAELFRREIVDQLLEHTNIEE